MSKAWMPLYVGDLEADTADLGPTEFGIYIRLLMHAWSNNGQIPLDPRKLCNITRCDPRFWWRFGKPVIDRYWDCAVDGSTATQKRLLTELRRSDEISNKRKASALQKHTKSSANAKQLHTQSQSQAIEEEDKIVRLAVAAAPAATGKYAYEGRVVRLNAKDYARWKQLYVNINLDAELDARDRWLSEQPEPVRKKWFNSTSQFLCNRDQAAKERIAAAQLKPAAGRNTGGAWI